MRYTLEERALAKEMSKFEDHNWRNNSVNNRKKNGVQPELRSISKIGKKLRRRRSAYSPEQQAILEEFFSKSVYLRKMDRSILSQRLEIDEKQITTWFQNRRTKKKKNLDFSDYCSDCSKSRCSSTPSDADISQNISVPQYNIQDDIHSQEEYIFPYSPEQYAQRNEWHIEFTKVEPTPYCDDNASMQPKPESTNVQQALYFDESANVQPTPYFDKCTNVQQTPYLHECTNVPPIAYFHENTNDQPKPYFNAEQYQHEMPLNQLNFCYHKNSQYHYNNYQETNVQYY